MQERIITALARDHRSLCVVGDDDQSIYAWRGAEIAHILDFARRWPGARVVRLEENYRSTPEIIGAANRLIEHNARRHGKTLVSSAASGVPPAVLQAQDEADEARRTRSCPVNNSSTSSSRSSKSTAPAVRSACW
ncbi:MAG: UvrD-helicase domain-containing protein [Phycisphaerales bacterium]